MVREDANSINDDTPYMGGQVLNIDTENMVVTMVAHRGWGPDGKTIYYIVTDATPEMPANMMGVSHAPINEQLVGTPVSSRSVPVYKWNKWFWTDGIPSRNRRKCSR